MFFFFNFHHFIGRWFSFSTSFSFFIILRHFHSTFHSLVIPVFYFFIVLLFWSSRFLHWTWLIWMYLLLDERLIMIVDRFLLFFTVWFLIWFVIFFFPSSINSQYIQYTYTVLLEWFYSSESTLLTRKCNA